MNQDWGQRRKSYSLYKKPIGCISPHTLPLPDAVFDFRPSVLSREQRACQKSDPGGDNYCVGCLGQTRVSSILSLSLFFFFFLVGGWGGGGGTRAVLKGTTLWKKSLMFVHDCVLFLLWIEKTKTKTKTRMTTSVLNLLCVWILF